MKKIITALALLAAALTGTLVGTAPAQATGEAPLGRWSEPVLRIYAPDLSNDWKLGRAIRDWNRAGVVDVKRVSGPCVMCVSVTEVEPYAVDEVSVQWHGLAYVNAPDGLILGCRIDLASDVHPNVRPRIVAHELGHCLGLPHRDSTRSAMGEGLGGGPTPSDHRRLARLYGGTW